MKPICIFTTFWDANTFIDNKINICNKNYNLNNCKIYSIALGIPDYKKIPNLVNLVRLDIFCPTYSLLKEYKVDGDWIKYDTQYRKIIRSRKENITSWLSSLKEDCIYVLCCWENTSNGSKCHRRILFNALRGTSIWKDKAIWVYGDGDGTYRDISGE